MGAAGFAEGGIGAGVSGGILSSIGQMIGLEAQAGAASYNAAVSRENAAVANQNAALVSQAGEQQTTMAGLRNRANIGALTTNTAASGLSVNSASPVSVRSSANEVGNLDAYQVRSNAIKEAYGYETQAENLKAQSTLDTYESQQARAAIPYAMSGTILGTGGQAANNYSNFLLQGGLNG